MRLNQYALLLAGALALGACGDDTTSPPAGQLSADVIDLVPDFARSGTMIMDRAGIGGAAFPDSIALTTEQKGAIEALHAGFMSTTATDRAALEALEVEARKARADGKSREEIKAILQRAIPIRARMASAFETLRAAILAIYTPAQRAWLEANKTKECGPDGGPQLTEAQLAQIKALKDGFETTYRADITTIRAVAAEAKTARAAGKTEAEVKVILAKAAEARDRVRAGEKKLYEDIMALLTPAQRAAWCVGRGMRGAGGPVGNG